MVYLNSVDEAESNDTQHDPVKTTPVNNHPDFLPLTSIGAAMIYTVELVSTSTFQKYIHFPKTDPKHSECPAVRLIKTKH